MFNRKKIFALIFVALLSFVFATSGAFADVEINSTNFPDVIFRAYVSGAALSADKDQDGVLSDTEIAKVTSINFSQHHIDGRGNFPSLKGIEYFTALTELICEDNDLINLDISKNTALRILECNENQLTTLDVSKNTDLQRLWCGMNKLTALDISNNTVLKELSCGGNDITSLNVSKNTALMDLECASNDLTNLDVSKNINLTSLYCVSNQLTTLDVSNNTALVSFDCYSQDVSTITPIILEPNGRWIFELSFLSPDISQFTSKITDFVAFTSGDVSVSYTRSDDIFYFDERPAYLIYNYATGYNNVNMDVRVSLTPTTYADDILDNPSVPVNDRAYIHNFTMSSALRNNIASSFGVNSSQIFQFSDSEILADTWTLDNTDSTAITNLGDQIIINIPRVRPNNTGVYVMRFSLDNATVGETLKIQGVTDSSSSESVGSSALENLEYKFFDQNNNEITTVPNDKVVYAAVRTTAGRTSGGVITTQSQGTEIEFARITPVELSEDIIQRLANNISVDRSAIKLLTSRDFSSAEPPEPTQAMKDQVQKDNYEFMAKLNTITVSEDGYYVFAITVPDNLVGTKVSDLRLLYAESSDFTGSSLKSSFVIMEGIMNGITGGFEFSNLFGVKIDTLTKQVLATVFLSAGKSLTMYILKILLFLAGCNAGFGMLGLSVGGFLIWKFFRRHS
ncbi:MAG: hypothetical protein IJT36_09540 [Alphaproteobacteria bacterium]|nr:hypothetical protein [Alphaproteobacteria bacterium]